MLWHQASLPDVEPGILARQPGVASHFALELNENRVGIHCQPVREGRKSLFGRFVAKPGRAVGKPPSTSVRNE